MQSTSIKGKDFTGLNLYVGMDVHFKSWKVHIYSDEFELKSFSQDPSVDQLTKHLKENYPGANYLLAYEAGFCGFWIHRAFKERGIDCRVIHPADVPTSNKEQLRKTDKVDSRKIAKGLKNGELNFIHIPDAQSELDRQLVRSRLTMARDTTRIKNRLKGLMKLYGIEPPDHFSTSRKWPLRFIKWMKTIDLNSLSGNLTLQTFLGELTFLNEQKKKLEATIKDLSAEPKYQKKVELLKSIPSVGLLTAMVVLTEIGDITRFKRLDQLCSFCGLAPNCHDSGLSEGNQRMSRRGNAILKTSLIECAWVLVKKDPAMLMYYKEQIVKVRAQKAIIKVARKLLSRIRYVLLNEQSYQLGIVK